jgi:putative copper export protein
MELKTLVILHTLGAAIWVGGHLVLLIVFVPPALKSKNPAIIRQFEERYEKIGVPSLLLQLLTGLRLAYLQLPSFGDWFDLNIHLGFHISLKLFLLALTIALGAHARLRIIPKLSESNLTALAWHILAINVLGVSLLITGLSVRFAIW